MALKMIILSLIQALLLTCKLTAGLPDPKAFWPLDRDEQLNDVSGNGNHGVNAGGAVLVPNADGTRAGAYQFTSSGNSYIEFPNDGAYDTRYSIHMLMYIYPQGTFGPTFNFKRDAWGVHMYSGDAGHFVRFCVRNSLAFTQHLWVNALQLNQWNFIGASYNYNTGQAKLWVMDQVVASTNIGRVELATNYEARMGVRNGDGRYLRAMVSCMQVYDRELTPSEILEAESQCKIGTAPLTTEAPAPPPEGLPQPVAFWPLDKDAQLTDASGNGNHGVNAGGAILVSDADGTLAGAYQFTSSGNSYIEFPNNGAYDTRYSIHMLMYIYPQGTFGPTFNFKRDAWGVHMYSGDAGHFVRFCVRNSLAFTQHLWVNALQLNQWNFIGASYNYNTGLAKLWVMDQVVASTNIGRVELATNYEARMGVRNGDGRYLRAMVSCMQVYDRELSPSEILQAESLCKIGTAPVVTTLAPTPNPDAIEGEVAFWPLDKDELLNDVSGNANHGVNAGGAILVPDADGTRAWAYQFTSSGNSYIEFPNNGAYDTRYSIHMLMYIYPQGTFGPTFNFKRDAWGVHMYSGDAGHFVRFCVRNSLAFTQHLWVNALQLNQWNFIGASYNYNTGLAKLWVMDQVVASTNIGRVELATNYEARMGVRNGDGRYLRAMVSCMQVYNRELEPSEILRAEKRCKIGEAPTTPEPKKTTAEPIVTTPEPKITTPEPKVTTPEPKITTEAPKITTEKLAVTTEGCTVPEGLRNEAVGSPATQSSKKGGAKAGRAVDGNADGDMAKGKSCSKTSEEDNPWWMVDLGRSTNVYVVTITNRQDCCSDELIGAEVRVGDSANFEDNPVCGARVSAADIGKPTIEIICACGEPMVGRHVSVQLPGVSGSLTLCEVNVGGIPIATEAPEECVVPDGLGNIAVGKSASQSSDAGNAVASRAVDGNNNSNFKERSCSKTGKEADPWWMVDLGSSQDVYQVTITNRQDCCAEKLVGAEIRVGDNRNRLGNAVCGARISAKDVEKETIDIICACGEPLNGRFVSVQLVGVEGALTLCEVAIMSEAVVPPAKTTESFTTEEPCILPDTIENVIRPGTRVEQSSTKSVYKASRAVDGNKNSDLRAGFCSSTLKEFEPWLMVDLGVTRNIHQVTITNRQDCCGFRLKGAVIRVGDNPDHTKNPVCGGPLSDRRATFETVPVICGCDDPMPGRYISVQLFNKTQMLTICELEALAMASGLTMPPLEKTEAPPTPGYTTEEPCVLPDTIENVIRPGTRAEQSSTKSVYKASRAVDGNKNSDLRAGFCSSTLKEFEPWLMVDLGATRNIHQVTITNRQDCCGFRLKGAVVRVGDNPDHTKNPVCGGPLSDRRATFETVPVICGCDDPMPGRYISVQLFNKTQMLTICELEALAMPSGQTLPPVEVTEAPPTAGYTTEEPCILPDTVVNIVTPSTKIEQSSVNKGNVPERAVDGNKDSNLGGGSCAMTKKEHEPYMILDLRSRRDIHQVTITNRQDCCAFRLKGVEVRVGNSPDPKSNPVCGKGPISDRRALAETVNIVCGCDVPMKGRYVSLQLADKTHFLTVCEIEVFAAP
ncbi:uncharacterized protein [Ptychodera flava]|uniref:uncharacterized protein n=1 Tax=Ptychodera flava TaxID=63121 RepID=UPI003969DCAB